MSWSNFFCKNVKKLKRVFAARTYRLQIGQNNPVKRWESIITQLDDNSSNLVPIITKEMHH